MESSANSTGRREKAFVARRFTERVESAILDRFDVVRPDHDLPVSAESLAVMARGCSTIFVSTTERMPDMVFDALAPSLKTVATLSVGFDHISLTAARRHGVNVLITPDVLNAACAEIAMLLILNASRRGHEANQLVRSGLWTGLSPTLLLGEGLHGRRLGILGMGRIGREVAIRAGAFGMAISYHNRTRLPQEAERGAHYHATIEDLMRESDVLCICAPGGPEMRGLVNRQRIDLMPDAAIIVNVARGDIIDDDALIDALRKRRIFAAGLDVFNGEPAIDHRYASLPNAFLTPHIGSATTATRDAMGMLLIDGVDALARGEIPLNLV